MGSGILKFIGIAFAQALGRTVALPVLIAAGLNSEIIIRWFSGSLGYQLPWYLSPQSIGLFSLFCALLLAISIFYGQYERDHGYAAARKISVFSLEFMSITEAAEHILNESAWASREYARLNVKTFVKDEVPNEIQRAARVSQIRLVGTPPNSATSVEIDPAYWQHIGIDRDRIWDLRNRTFTWFPTSTVSIPGLVNYEHGRVPRVEVIHVWPRASMLLKLSCSLWVQTKKTWWWFKAKVGLS